MVLFCTHNSTKQTIHSTQTRVCAKALLKTHETVTFSDICPTRSDQSSVRIACLSYKILQKYFLTASQPPSAPCLGWRAQPPRYTLRLAWSGQNTCRYQFQPRPAKPSPKVLRLTGPKGLAYEMKSELSPETLCLSVFLM